MTARPVTAHKWPDRAERNPEFIQTQREKVAYLDVREAEWDSDIFSGYLFHLWDIFIDRETQHNTCKNTFFIQSLWTFSHILKSVSVCQHGNITYCKEFHAKKCRHLQKTQLDDF